MAEQMQIHMDDLMNNCLTKATLTTVAGGAMGVLFGMFFGANSLSAHTVSHDPAVKIPLRTQMVTHYREMVRSGASMGRNFAIVGGLFSLTECVVEKHRGTSDHLNGLIGGFLTGGMLAYKGGFPAMASGAVFFAAFSYAIDTFFQEKDPRSKMLPYDPEVDHPEDDIVLEEPSESRIQDSDE